MQPKSWKNFFFWILLASNSANFCCAKKVDAAWTTNSELRNGKDALASTIPSLEVAGITHWRYQKHGTPPITEQNLAQTTLPSPSNPSNDPPQLEGQPADLTKPNIIPSIEQRLQKVPELDWEQRLQRLQQRLSEKKQPTNDEPSGFGELGKLLVREQPLEQPPPPSQQPPVIQPKPIGNLLARVGYFYSSNIFSSQENPREDGLIYSGLTLASAPLRLGRNTYLNGSIDGNIIRYINQSQFNYNQLRFNVSVSQKLSPRMYGEIGWTNQQFFYTRNTSFYNAGDRFLNENSVQLSFGRRDPLTPKLILDSFYELRLSFTDPPSNQNNRDRLTNSLWLSLNYYWKKSLQIGLNYQFSLSDFTNRERQDLYHRMYGQFNYGVSKYTTITLQGGVILGDSTDSNIDFDNWFFTVNYNLELGRF